jgi:hypothetical protein
MHTIKTQVGLATILLALGYNIPYGLLASNFDYPGILRLPPEEILAAFSRGGTPLILTWYAFGLGAMAMVVIAPMLAMVDKSWKDRPITTVVAIVAGSLAGLVQAMGLWRWVFVVPALAASHASDPATTNQAFAVLNLYGGVTIGEHMGQILTCLWVASLTLAQPRPTTRLGASVAGSALISVAGIGLGLGDGLALALDSPNPLFGIATTVGFIGLTLWLVLRGVELIWSAREKAA